MRPVDYLFLAVLAVAACVAAWIFAQDWAARKINAKKDAIRKFLSKYDYTLTELGHQDTSPSGMQYTIVDGAKVGLTPFRFYRLIKKAHRDLKGNEITTLYDECRTRNAQYLAELQKHRSL